MTKEQIESYESQLKPCPFCGNKATILKLSGVDGYYVRCTAKWPICKIEPSTTLFKQSIQDAVDDWNTRSN